MKTLFINIEITNGYANIIKKHYTKLIYRCIIDYEGGYQNEYYSY